MKTKKRGVKTSTWKSVYKTINNYIKTWKLFLKNNKWAELTIKIRIGTKTSNKNKKNN